jgi:transcriptional regulator with PAS, ATPase and Fis domain
MLRVIEDGVVIPVGSNKPGVVDVRIISATNHNLRKLIEENEFREDLYFRIRGVDIYLPALRERPQDIPPLVWNFLQEAVEETGSRVTGITDAAMRILVGYEWPGIRQLKNRSARWSSCATATRLTSRTCRRKSPCDGN